MYVRHMCRSSAAEAGALDRADLYSRAADMEGHPDNVAPCVYGGFTQAWRTGKSWRALRTQPSARLRPIVCVPEERLSTERARGLLPGSVPHGDAAFTLARAALLPRAVCEHTELLWEATEDRLHQDHRAAAMPESLALLRRLREEEGLAAVVSGAGPSVLVLVDAGPAPHDHNGRELSGEPVDSIARQAGTSWHIHPSQVDSGGFAVVFSRS
jgi:homoserine kinase